MRKPTKLICASMLLILMIGNMQFFAAGSFAGPRQNEILTKGALHQIYTAEIAYKNGVGNGRFGTLADLFHAGLIDSHLGAGVKFGYYFSNIFSSGNDTMPPKIVVHAIPVVYRKTGKSSYLINEQCQLRGADTGGSEADDSAPIISQCL